LGVLNGLAQGFASFARAFAPFVAGFLWSEFSGVDDDVVPMWPLGPYLTWNVFGLICLVAFIASLWLEKPKRVDTDDAEDVETN
jgi:MFS family permease